jgi:hypothetical protein
MINNVSKPKTKSGFEKPSGTTGKILHNLSLWFVEGKFPSFLGILLLIVEIVVGLLFIQNKNLSDSALKNLVTPKDIKVSNITDSEFTVSWITDKKTTGYILLGDKGNNINNRYVSYQKDDNVYVHTVNVSGLKENTEYFYVIFSDKFSFLNRNEPWMTKTGKKIIDSPASELLAGRVLKGDGDPVGNASVFINVSGSVLLSTTTGEDGQWVVNLGTARNQTLDSYIKLIRDKSPIEIYVQSGIYGITYGRTTLSKVNILDPMKLGEVYIFNPKNENGVEKEIPDAEVIF